MSWPKLNTKAGEGSMQGAVDYDAWYHTKAS